MFDGPWDVLLVVGSVAIIFLGLLFMVPVYLNFPPEQMLLSPLASLFTGWGLCICGLWILFVVLC